jgi:crossover junction endodeoxyribonuclease RusA
MAAGRLWVNLTFVPPDKRRRDADNMLAAMKSGLDGLADALGVDDSQWKISFEVDRSRVGGFVRVEVMPCVA